MLEVLDPEQNHSFLDHYIDVSFDLSQVMFICTANIKHEIPAPLLDRMEVLELPGYILDEKVQIGSKYLIPRQRKAHGLNSRHLQILPSVLPKIIEEYTKEAGIRELERNIARICRKVAAKIVKGESQGEKITTRNLEEYLGPRRYFQETIKRTLIPGVAVGLAWTPYGGDILFIEATRMKGKESLRLTGKLGEIMNESAQIALSYVRSHASDFNIDTQIFEESLLHIHFPAGAVPKDGPSAGVTIAAALISLLKDKKGRRLNPKIAMTGELTLRGQVLPVGGIREKIIAAKRGGIKTIILPKENERDTKEIPPSTIKGLKFVFVERFEEIYETIFPET
jgi:ATP-dependent Lon protease